MDVVSMILQIVFAVVGLALIWFIVELALTVKKTRATVEDLKPTIDNVNKMVAELQPTISKVDPIVDRATLTVDSINLELMRVDEILEDISNITGGVSKTVDAVDSVTSAPIDIVTNVTKKISSKFKPRYASKESVDLGSEDDPQVKQNPFVEFVDVAGTAASDSVREEAVKRAQQRAAQQQAQVRHEQDVQSMNNTKSSIVDAVSANAAVDASAR